MFSSHTLRAVRPAVREQRLDDVVHVVEVRGPVTVADTTDLAVRLDRALAGGVRWLVLDLTRAPSIADPLLPALGAACRVLRARRGELIVAGADPTVAERLAATVATPDRPAQAATADQALRILKLLRPKTRVEAAPRRRARTSSLRLPRVEPLH